VTAATENQPLSGTPADIYCHGLSKAFDDTVAVEDVSLEVPAGQIMTLLGPSGCGKTTVLRLVAGFERLDQGQIEIGGQLVAGPDQHRPPERRRIGMVFQDYAIFPHLSVADNVAFGLSARSGRGEKQARIEAMLDFVGLAGLGERMPHELSGGQQQRVALARALAPEPRALLLDEPFSNLDASLRAEVRAEVRDLLRQSGTTTIFVTHDQEEALFFGDLIAVMNAGRIEQVGTPEEIYLRPLTRFVAAFMGQTDFIAGQVGHQGVETPLGRLAIEANLALDTPLEIALRPIHVALTAGDDPNGRILSRQFLGTAYLYRVALDDGLIIHSWQPHQAHFADGAAVRVAIRPGSQPAVFFQGRAIGW
jgi:iron(III) transport system ATP-binding protein